MVIITTAGCATHFGRGTGSAKAQWPVPSQSLLVVAHRLEIVYPSKEMDAQCH